MGNGPIGVAVAIGVGETIGPGGTIGVGVVVAAPPQAVSKAIKMEIRIRRVFMGQ
jgi:hypothetical protein